MHGTVGRNSAPTARRRSIVRALVDFAWLVRWWRARALVKQTKLALDSLDDAALKDIGLNRSIIPHVATTIGESADHPIEERIIPSRYY